MRTANGRALLDAEECCCSARWLEYLGLLYRVEPPSGLLPLVDEQGAGAGTLVTVATPSIAEVRKVVGEPSGGRAAGTHGISGRRVCAPRAACGH